MVRLLHHAHFDTKGEFLPFAATFTTGNFAQIQFIR